MAEDDHRAVAPGVLEVQLLTVDGCVRHAPSPVGIGNGNGSRSSNRERPSETDSTVPVRSGAGLPVRAHPVVHTRTGIRHQGSDVPLGERGKGEAP
ncbi:hypothetical protein GCM10010289_65400 [Streptomyces violascens]|uniref:Uncharacterized protein n=1 Tax=Streptomyces violascens TaxID=67381 RepID=A0ABQ3QNE9_9ACTN|nr:hypothetical protein GCM10010289_65400 [Streptomyces violascens]GHI38774.1 hypothetical protein Sviol_31820 [Streptomyces violascens]